MVIAGLIVTFLGFLLSLFSLTISSDATTRLAIVVVGIAVSLGGIIGMINPAYLAKAIWRK